MPLQIRRGTEAERLAMTVPLAPGEPLYTTDQGFLYIGNGSTLGGVQVTGYQDENAIDAVGNAFKNGTHQNIVFIYEEFPQDVANRIDSYIDLSYYDGEISAPAFRGSVLDDGSVTLVNATNGSINLDGTVKGNIIPDTNEAYDIGSSIYRFKDLYLSGTSLYLGNAVITANPDSSINLPAGSTINGIDIVSIAGGGVINADVIGDDSSVIVNVSNRSVTAVGGFTGNLTGNLVATDTTVLINATTKQIGYVGANLVGDLVGDVSGTVTGDVVANSVGTVFLDGSSSGEITVRTSLRVQSDLVVENEILGNLFGTHVGNVDSPDNVNLVDAIGKELSTGRLRLERNNITTLDFEEIVFQAPRIRYDFEAAPTVGNQILTGIENAQFVELYSEPDVGDHVAGSVMGVVAWSPVDNSGREYGQVFMGTQLDPGVAFTGTYGASKFFIVNSPDQVIGDSIPPEDFRYLTFDSFGRLAINQENALATLDVNGFAKLAILDTAPATPANGMIAIADGDSVSGWDPLGLGAPAKQQMVVYLGGGWRQIAVEP